LPSGPCRSLLLLRPVPLLIDKSSYCQVAAIQQPDKHQGIFRLGGGQPPFTDR
jgi:hypothetical protein